MWTFGSDPKRHRRDIEEVTRLAAGYHTTTGSNGCTRLRPEVRQAAAAASAVIFCLCLRQMMLLLNSDERHAINRSEDGIRWWSGQLVAGMAVHVSVP